MFEDRLKDQRKGRAKRKEMERKIKTGGRRVPVEGRTIVWGDATEERAFENDVEGFDNIQKGGEGRRAGGRATGTRGTEE